MDTQKLEYKLNLLPDELKKEVDLFVDFLINKSKIKDQKLKREPGFLAGKIKMEDDFDEPIEDFKDYM